LAHGRGRYEDYSSLHAQITELGATVVVTSPKEFATLIAEDVEKWGNVIRTSNIKPD
jgi:hypothetical protein